MSNVFSCVGRLTSDSESRATPSGAQVLQFNVANNQGFGDRQKTLYIRCSLWGKRGDNLQQYLVKGSQVFVSGELTENAFTNKEGLEKKSLELNINQVDFAGSKPTTQQSVPQAPSHAGQNANLDDDLPF